MVDPIFNAIVIIIFGLLIGAVLYVYNLTAAAHRPSIREQPTPSDAEIKEEGFLGNIIDAANKQAEEGVRLGAVPAVRMALLVCVGIIVMFIILVRYTPISMQWGYFFLSLFAGFVIFQGIFSLAKAGKIGAKTNRPGVRAN
jgi:hypothetical protein